MREACDQGFAIAHQGQLPALEAIAKWPGKRLRDPLNTGMQDQDLKKWTDEVPEQAEPALVGSGGKSK